MHARCTAQIHPTRAHLGLVAGSGRFREATEECCRRGQVSKECYDVVLEAFRKWGPRQVEAGWVLGDTLARKADKTRAADFVALAADTSLGWSRAFIVDALWRFKSVADVEPLLCQLVRDPDVSMYAMSALQRTIGAERTADFLTDLLAEVPEGKVADNARRQIKRARKAK